jgi:ribosomal-protein-alanine N-acetyltransferase
MIVRSHRPSDFDVLYRIDLECFPPGISYSRDELAGFIHHPTSKTWVAEEDGEIIGFLVAGRETRQTGHVITIDVPRKWRRHGIGKSLMGVAESWARRSGLDRLSLETGEDNRTAHKFYEALGYQIAGRIENYYSDGSAAWVMMKPLK